MELVWYQRNQEAVAEALRRGEQPDMATTMSSGPLDELIALHDELGIFAALDSMTVQRQRRGVPDALLLRSLAVLPFLASHSFRGASGQLFREPAVLLHLGWSAFQIREGDNERHRNPHGRTALSLPCHPETLRDELARVPESQWLGLQRAGVEELFRRNLVRGHVYAIDGTGLGDGLRLVCLVCVAQDRGLATAGGQRFGEGKGSGRDPQPDRATHRIGRCRAIQLLLVDALYTDGPLLA